MTPLISIVSGCYNERDNIDELYQRIKAVIKNLESEYRFEIIFIDNCSEDGTKEVLKNIANIDSNVKLIFNTRNFGHLRSPFWGILQSSGVATIYMASDLQDPPEKINDFLVEWRKGWLVVMAAKQTSETNFIFHEIRKFYYTIFNLMSRVKIVNNSTGFGLYDKKVIDQLRNLNDPYPFLRGIIAELGFPVKVVDFFQPKRVRGFSKNGLYDLYDIGILGLVSNTLLPIRVATFLGLSVGLISIFIGIIFLGLKLIFWNEFTLGLAPLIIGVFFFMGITLLFLGIIGEYVANIQGYVKNNPLVVESERINFDQ